jgi:hypothetical protein
MKKVILGAMVNLMGTRVLIGQSIANEEPTKAEPGVAKEIDSYLSFLVVENSPRNSPPGS